jgi:hypothetical protein
LIPLLNIKGCVMAAGTMQEFHRLYNHPLNRYIL